MRKLLKAQEDIMKTARALNKISKDHKSAYYLNIYLTNAIRSLDEAASYLEYLNT